MADGPVRPYPWAVAAVAAALFVAIRVVLLPSPATTADALDSDFLAFFTAGSMIADGRMPELYDLDAQLGDQQALQGPPDDTTVMGFFNPPPFALLVVPFAGFPAISALQGWRHLWDVAWLGLLLASLRMSRDTATDLAIAAAYVLFPPVVLARLSGQPVPMMLGGLLGALAATRARRPELAGLALALAWVKPHVALILGGWIAVTQGPRALAGFAVGTLAWVGASLAMGGWPLLASYADLLAMLARGGTGYGVKLEHTVTVRGMLSRILGEPPVWLWLPLSALTGVGLLAAARKVPAEAAIALAAVAVLLASPHALYHDQGLILVALLVLGARWVALGIFLAAWVGVVNLAWWPVIVFGSSVALGVSILIERAHPPTTG